MDALKSLMSGVAAVKDSTQNDSKQAAAEGGSEGVRSPAKGVESLNNGGPQ